MGDWSVEKYWAREQEWRQKAENALSANNRETCLLIAEGYAKLVAILEVELTREKGGGGTDWQGRAFSER